MIHDRWTSLFWLFLSLYVCVESLRLGIGTLHKPNIGFFAFCAAGMLGVLSLILFLQTFQKDNKTRSGSLFSGMLWRRALVVVIALIVYSMLMSRAGYLISTFCLMTLLFWILEPGRVRWFLWSLIASFLTTGISYYVFSVLLNCQFPAGIFEL
jgi:hypothetical protein